MRATDVQLAMFSASERYEVRFRSLVDDECMRFPCDPGGEVEMDCLGERERMTYLYARALIGRRFAFPVVVVASDSL